MVRQQMSFNPQDTGVVVIDPHNDVLSERGSGWVLLKDALRDNRTIENLERLFTAGKERGYPFFISPHYFYPTDDGWLFNDPLEALEHETRMFARRGALTLEGFADSGADWLERLKPYIEDGRTVVAGPHRLLGPQTNDLVLQLRKRHISKVILSGMMANLCVESHLRELLEQGFEIAVIADATAAPRHPEWGDGYPGALVNFRYLAHAVLSTEQIVTALTSR